MVQYPPSHEQSRDQSRIRESTRMSQEVAIDLLVISRQTAPPAASAVSQAFAAAGLGALDYTPATMQGGSSEKVERMRVGTHSISLPWAAANARVITWQYMQPVTEGMGEAAFSALTRGADADTTHVLRSGTVACNLRLSVPDDNTARALSWAHLALVALLDVTHGVALDPSAQRCFGRDKAAQMDAQDPLIHIAFHDEPWDVGTRWMHTHGLQKFGRPELDLVAVPVSLAAEGLVLLRDLATHLATGERLAAGDEVELDDAGKILAVNVPSDVDHQSPTGRLRLVDAPQPGERIGQRIARVLKRTALLEAGRRLEADDIMAASEAIERVLADDPDDCGALAMKARVALQRGDPMEALDLGEFMELRVPDDYRGSLTVGMALTALGRYREALHALDRAIEIEPEAADAFSQRAEAHERLGHEQLASVDRAHANYLAG